MSHISMLSVKDDRVTALVNVKGDQFRVSFDTDAEISAANRDKLAIQMAKDKSKAEEAANA